MSLTDPAGLILLDGNETVDAVAVKAEVAFMVTIRERMARQRMDDAGMPDTKLRWEVTHRFEAPSSKEALRLAMEKLGVNPQCSVTIMVKR